MVARLEFYLFLQSVRPVENSSNPLMVDFEVSLHQIVDLDEKNQILTTSCWLTQVHIFEKFLSNFSTTYDFEKL